jgi:transposase
MVWGCIFGDKLDPIGFIDGTINTQVYIDILADIFLPFIDALNADGITDIIFQQDNATPHTAKRTQKSLENWAHEYGFSVMQCPPNSPNMNPIEHIWPHLKLELHRRYPDTKCLRGSSDAIRQILQAQLRKIWWQIGKQMLSDLINSVRRNSRKRLSMAVLSYI